jgi:hypothetical protein
MADAAERDRVIAKALAYAVAFIDSFPPDKQVASERHTMLALLRAYASLASESAREQASSATTTSADILDALASDIEFRSGRRIYL